MTAGVGILCDCVEVMGWHREPYLCEGERCFMSEFERLIKSNDGKERERKGDGDTYPQFQKPKRWKSKSREKLLTEQTWKWCGRDVFWIFCCSGAAANVATPVWFNITLSNNLALHGDLKSLLWLMRTSRLACTSLKGPFHSAELWKSGYQHQEGMEVLLLPPCWSRRSSPSWHPYLTLWHEWELLQTWSISASPGECGNASYNVLRDCLRVKIAGRWSRLGKLPGLPAKKVVPSVCMTQNETV